MKYKQTNSECQFRHNQYPLEAGLRLIEASAGTGKTFALAHLVLRLITEAKHKVKEILVVTFTESAAAELKARICNRLELTLKCLESIENGSVFEVPDDVLKEWLDIHSVEARKRSDYIALLLEALELLDTSDITTIHGFCRRTLSRDVLESSDGINQVLETDVKPLAIQVANDYWQKQVLVMDDEDLRGLQNAGFTLDNLVNSLLKLDNDPSLNLEAEKQDFDSNKPLAIQFKKYLEHRWQEFVTCWRLDGEKLELDFRSSSDEWRSCGCRDTKPFSPKPKKDRHAVLSNWIADSPHFTSVDDQNSYLSYGMVRDQDELSNYFHPSIFSKVSQRCGDDITKLPRHRLQESIADLLDGPAEQAWRHALSCCLASLSKLRNQLGLTTYSDLLFALDKGISSHNDLINENMNRSSWIRTIRRRYRVALIDEFQDTDPLQWRILRDLFATSKDHLLVMVGDPKQSIYRFRGGDLRTYMNVKSQVERVDVLLENFRASPSLMEALNSFMSTGLYHSKLEIPALMPCGEESFISLPEKQFPLQLITLDQENESHSEATESLPSKTNLEEIIPTVIGNAVLDLLNSDNIHVEPNDICILVSRHDQASAIRSRFALFGLPTRLVSSGDVFQSEAAHSLQCFLDCIAQPGHSESLRLVACSALYQWDVKKLEASEENGELDDLASQFSSLSRDFTKLGLLGCLAKQLEGRMIADLSNRGRFLGDLQQCAQLVQEEIHSKSFDSPSASAWLRRERLQISDSLSENRQPNSDFEERAISVLTVHRSKGLEYKVVFCPYLWEAPSRSKEPLLRHDEDSTWHLSINPGWGSAKEVASEIYMSALQESERLAYVAMTRSRSLLILVWAKGQKQEGNPLSSFLFGPEASTGSISRLSPSLMKEWLLKNEVNLTIIKAQTKDVGKRWNRKLSCGELNVGDTPARSLEISWSRSSYSSWISEHSYSQVLASDNPILLEEGRDIDQENYMESVALKDSIENRQESVNKYKWSDQGPLARFPRGALAGDCLHRILERIDFCKPLQSPQSSLVIETELIRSGLDKDLLPTVQEGLDLVLSTPLGGVLGSLKFNQLDTNRRLHEVSFDLPIAHSGKALTPRDLAKVFLEDPEARFSSSYSELISELNFFSKGFFTGSIDLVFTDDPDLLKARWWVVDWKSNWIGTSDERGQCMTCGPFHYSDEAMEQQMLHHHYPLQAHLYLLALHRYLSWRLPGYDPKLHLGGYVYVFLRGVPGVEAVIQNCANNLPGVVLERVPLTRVLELDRLLREGGK